MFCFGQIFCGFSLGSQEAVTSKTAEWLMCFSSPFWHLSDRPNSFCIFQSSSWNAAILWEWKKENSVVVGDGYFQSRENGPVISSICVFVSNVRLMVGGCIVLLQGACVGGSGLKQKLDCCTNWNVIPVTCDGFLLSVVKGVGAGGLF